jgi:hypothetical protein
VCTYRLELSAVLQERLDNPIDLGKLCLAHGPYGLPHPEYAFVSQAVVHRDALAADLDQVSGTQHLQVL